MGWSSANPIFEVVADAMLSLGNEGYALRYPLEELIKELQAGDWDTEDESLERYRNCPDIVKAFKNCGVELPCDCKCCDHET